MLTLLMFGNTWAGHAADFALMAWIVHFLRCPQRWLKKDSDHACRDAYRAMRRRIKGETHP